MLPDRWFVQREHVRSLHIIDVEPGGVDYLCRIIGDEVEHKGPGGTEAHVAHIGHGLPLHSEFLAEPEVLGLADSLGLFAQSFFGDHLHHALGAVLEVGDGDLPAVLLQDEILVLSLGLLCDLFPLEVPGQLGQGVPLALYVEGFVPSERSPGDLYALGGDHLLYQVEGAYGCLGLRQAVAQVGIRIEHYALSAHLLHGIRYIRRGLRGDLDDLVLVVLLDSYENHEYLLHTAFVRVLGYLFRHRRSFLGLEFHRVRVDIQCSHDTRSFLDARLLQTVAYQGRALRRGYKKV